MRNRFKSYLESTTIRHYVRVVAFVVLGISLGAILMLEAYPYIVSYRIVGDRQPGAGVVEEHNATSTYALSRSLPTSIRIPKINLDTTFEEPLGLNQDRTVETPHSFEKVGWYKNGPAPGEVGPAVVLGHVDSYKGPAVFYSLGQLKPGDRVYVTREDGSEAEFEVMYFERYRQDEFPSELVYGPVSYPALRLITCTGVYDHGTQRYSHNLVVYAKLVDPSVATSTGATIGPSD